MVGPDTGEMTLYIMVTTLEGNDQSISGTGSYLATTTLLSSQSSDYEVDPGDVISIDITTNFPDIWTEIFDDMASENLLSSPGDYMITYGVDVNGNPNMTVSFNTLDNIEVRNSLFRIDLN